MGDWADERRRRVERRWNWAAFLTIGGLLLWLSTLTGCASDAAARVQVKLELGACDVCEDPPRDMEPDAAEPGAVLPADTSGCGHPRLVRLAVSVNAPTGGETTDKRDRGTPEWLLWLVLGGLALAALFWAWRAGLLGRWLGPGAREGAPPVVGDGSPPADRTGLDESDRSG